jgi:hypothetical protein
MKKIILILALALAFLTSSVWAATPGTCVQTPYQLSPMSFMVRFVCTDSADGGGMATQTIPASTMAELIGNYFLYSVTAYRTVGGTAPDAADIQVLMNGMDLLGGKGVNLIPATATPNDTLPYSAFMASYRYVRINNTITMPIANQATASANYTIDLDFER